MSKPVLVSGIKPSGKLHIGNYLGALKNFVELQNSGKYECYFFVADLHSLTELDANKDSLAENIQEIAASYLAAGLDPEKSTLFIQSQIPSHLELFWVLNCLTPMGELSRMTQFKDKGGGNAGLFTYPVLMAADIFLYDAEKVPVGEDQLQHLELARTLARKFNNKFGEAFIEPKPILTETARVMSLDDPTKKMSKTRPVGCLFLDDTPEIIEQKIKKAVTDSGSEVKFDEKKKPAISNLLGIYSAFSGESIKAIEKKFKNKSYAEFKENLAGVVIAGLSDFQKRKSVLKDKAQEIEKIFNAGAERASVIADKKISVIKEKIGLPVKI